MSFGLFAIGAAVVGAIFAFLFRPKPESPDMAPATLDSFSITTANEGSVVPIVFGKVRIPGNIIWYGNLITEEVTEEAGGKGGGGGETVVGYNYYLDVWEALCYGKISLIKTYVQDKEQTISASSTDFNDGTQSIYPTEPGTYANRIPRVAHIFWKKWFLGENQTYVPTVHFVVERDLGSSPINHAVMSNGHNPAAIIYQILIDNGASVSDIDLSSFNDAADYWYNQGYGLNLILSSSQKAKKQIAHVLSYVGGAFGEDDEGRFFLKAFDPNDSAVATVNTEDFLDFTFTRKTWDQTYNIFRGTYLDESKDFTQRVLIIGNRANIQLQGRQRVLNVDLKAFRDVDAASKRLWEIMKEQSYPGAQIEFVTTMKFRSVKVGEIVEINNSEYGISSAEFRVINKDISEIDKNRISWRAIQVTETLFDDNYETAGGSEWTNPDYTPAALVHQAIFELPYNPTYGHDTAYLMLAARVHSFETGWVAMVSSTGTDYESYGKFTGWAQYGTLDETYPDDTYSIDDETGILFTPYRDDPTFNTISRTDLFGKNRFALLGNEIVRFERVTPVGSNQYRLEGIVRGVLNTPVESHSSGSDIWLFNLSENILTGVPSSDFYVKMLPYFGAVTVDPSDATAIHVTSIGKAKVPWPVCRIKVVRSGSSLSVEWWPTNQDNKGAGTTDADAQTDQDPMLYDGDFEVYESVSGLGSSVIVNGTSTTLTQASACTVYVRARLNGQVSDWKSVYVSSGDGTYIGPDA